MMPILKKVNGAISRFVSLLLGLSPMRQILTFP